MNILSSFFNGVKVSSSVFLAVLAGSSPAVYAQSLNLSWTQEIGTSGTSGSGSHVNSYLRSDGTTLVSRGTILSHGKVSDNQRTFDYVVRFAGAEAPLGSRLANNAFVVHRNASADFYSESAGTFGSGGSSGTFADNGNAAISLSFYEEDSFNPVTNSGVKSFARLALVAINEQPTTVGGAKIGNLNTNEFYDVDWSGNRTFRKSFDPESQIVLTTEQGSTSLVNYAVNTNGSTGPSDPGSGGLVDPLESVLRLEFNEHHAVEAARWRVDLGEAHEYTIKRPGDPGKRSGIGFSAVPEPSSLLLSLVALAGCAIGRRR